MMENLLVTSTGTICSRGTIHTWEVEMTQTEKGWTVSVTIDHEHRGKTTINDHDIRTAIPKAISHFI